MDLSRMSRYRAIIAMAGIIIAALLLTTGCKKTEEGKRDDKNTDEVSHKAAPMSAPMSAPWNEARVGDRIEIRHEDEIMQTIEVVEVTETEVIVRSSEIFPEGGVGPEEQRFSRQYAGDSGFADKFSALLANKVGTFSFMIGKKEILCDVYEKTVVNGSRKLVWKIYINPEVPGMIVKKEISTNGGPFKVVMQVISFSRTAE